MQRVLLGPAPHLLYLFRTTHGWMTSMSKNDDIVLVDDEKHILSALRRALHSLGKNIICFTSPREALAYVKDNQPGIIISDQRMACMSGTELLSQCHEIWPDTPCILLSAFHDFDSVAEALPTITCFKGSHSFQLLTIVFFSIIN